MDDERTPLLAAAQQSPATSGSHPHRSFLFHFLAYIWSLVLLAFAVVADAHLASFPIKISDINLFSIPCLVYLALELLTGSHKSYVAKFRLIQARRCTHCRNQNKTAYIRREQEGEKKKAELRKILTAPHGMPHVQPSRSASTASAPFSNGHRDYSSLLWCWLNSILSAFLALFHIFSKWEMLNIFTIGVTLGLVEHLSTNGNANLKTGPDFMPRGLLQFFEFSLEVAMLYFVRASIAHKYHTTSQARQRHLAALIVRWASLFLFCVVLSSLVLFLSFMYDRDGPTGYLTFDSLQSDAVELEVFLLLAMTWIEYLLASTSVSIENHDILFLRLPFRFLAGFAAIVCGPVPHLVAVWWCYLADTAVPSAMHGNLRWVWTTMAWLVLILLCCAVWIRDKLNQKLLVQKIKVVFSLFMSHCWDKEKHDRKTHVRVNLINGILKQLGFLPWFDENELLASGNISVQIIDAINNSVFFIAFLTPQYVEKVGDGKNSEESCCNELNYAINSGKIIIFVILDTGNNDIRTIRPEPKANDGSSQEAPQQEAEGYLDCDSTKLNELLRFIPKSRHYDLTDWRPREENDTILYTEKEKVAAKEFERLCNNIRNAANRFPDQFNLPSPASTAVTQVGGNGQVGQQTNPLSGGAQESDNGRVASKLKLTNRESNIERPRLLEFVLMTPTVIFYVLFLLKIRAGLPLFDDLEMRMLGAVVCSGCLHLISTDVDSSDYVNRRHMLPSRWEIVHIFALVGCVMITVMESHGQLNELIALGVAVGLSLLVLSLIYILRSSNHNKFVFNAFAIRQHLAGVLRRGYFCILVLGLIMFYSSSMSVRHDVSVLHPWQAAEVIPLLNAHIFLLFLFFELLRVDPKINPEIGDISALRIPHLDKIRLFLLFFPTAWMLLMLWCWAADSELPVFLQTVEPYDQEIFAGCWVTVALSFVISQWRQVCCWSESIVDCIKTETYDIIVLGTREDEAKVRGTLAVRNIQVRPKDADQISTRSLRVTYSHDVYAVNTINLFGCLNSRNMNSTTAIVCLSKEYIKHVGDIGDVGDIGNTQGNTEGAHADDGAATNDCRLFYEVVVRNKPRAILPLCDDVVFPESGRPNLGNGLVGQTLSWSKAVCARMSDASNMDSEKFGQFKRMLGQVLDSHCGLVIIGVDSPVVNPDPPSQTPEPSLPLPRQPRTEIVKQLYSQSIVFQLACVAVIGVVFLFLFIENGFMEWFAFDRGFLNVIRFTPISFSIICLLFFDGSRRTAAVRVNLIPDSVCSFLINQARRRNFRTLEKLIRNFYGWISPIELIYLLAVVFYCFLMFQSFKELRGDKATAGMVFSQDNEMVRRSVIASLVALLSGFTMIRTRRQMVYRLAGDPLGLSKRVAGCTGRVLFVIFLQLIVVGGSLAISWRFGDSSEFAIQMTDASIIFNVCLVCAVVANEVLLASDDIDLTNFDIQFLRLPAHYCCGVIVAITAFLFCGVYLFSNALYHSSESSTFVASLDGYYFETLCVIWALASCCFASESIRDLPTTIKDYCRKIFPSLQNEKAPKPKLLVVFNSQSIDDVGKVQRVAARFTLEGFDVWPKFPSFNRTFKCNWSEFKEAFKDSAESNNHTEAIVVIFVSESFLDRINAAQQGSMDARECANEYNYAVNNTTLCTTVVLDNCFNVANGASVPSDFRIAMGLISMRLDPRSIIHLTANPGEKSFTENLDRLVAAVFDDTEVPLSESDSIVDSMC